MLILYTITIFVSAALLFLVQPMFSRMALPLLGGSPAVWNTALVFYQAALLAGYAYAHASTRWLGVRRQAALHFALLLLPLLVLPIAIPAGWTPPTDTNPSLWLLGLLAVSVGLPFFAVSTSSPLLQKWFAATEHSAAADPYFLYAASNAGSLLALVGYPLLVEPHWRLAEQSRWWAVGYGLLVALTAGCGLWLWKSPRLNSANNAATPVVAGIKNAEGDFFLSPREERVGRESERGEMDEKTASFPQPSPPLGEEREPKHAAAHEADSLPATTGTPSARRRVRWVLLSFVPSSLMVSVTTYLSSDVAAVPLLWVIPLAIYLLTFVLVFARRALVPDALLKRALPIVLVALVLLLAMQATEPIALLMSLHLLAFFTVAMVCHGEIARDRPTTQHLTEFYLWMSVGGVLGGAFNALLAPLIFTTVAEYPVTLVLACLLGIRADSAEVNRRKMFFDFIAPASLGVLTLGLIALVPKLLSPGDSLAAGLIFAPPVLACFFCSQRPLRFGLGLAIILLAGTFHQGEQGRLLHSARSFFGIHRVTVDATGQFHLLVHGKTIHGMQSLEPGRRAEPLTYYHRTGPMGQVFAAYGAELKLPVAVVGLGAGSLASYGQPGQAWTFYEIDPVVERLAKDARYFTYLRDSPANVKVVLGDARLSLTSAPKQSYGLIVLDAYSSDAIPIHLLTREALRLYLDKLAPHGLLAFHISNLHLDLKPVLARLANDAGLACRVQSDTNLSPAEKAEGKRASQWLVMARAPADLARLTADPRWEACPAETSKQAVWTDDYSSILDVFTLR